MPTPRAASLSQLLALLLALFAVTACGSGNGSPPPNEPVGTLSLALGGTTPSGTQYRLRAAAFDIVRQNIAGLSPLTLSSEDDPDASQLSANLRPGPYTVTLEPGWFLERRGPNEETFQPASDARLTSPNPVSVTIEINVTASIVFQFEVDGGQALNLGTGTLSITTAVSEKTLFSHGFASADDLADWQTIGLFDDTRMSFDPNDGSPAPGSMNIHITHSPDKPPATEVFMDTSGPSGLGIDLSGKTISGWVRLDTFGATNVQVSLQLDSHGAFASSALVTLDPSGGWTELSVNADHPARSGSRPRFPFAPTQVDQIILVIENYDVTNVNLHFDSLGYE